MTINKKLSRAKTRASLLFRSFLICLTPPCYHRPLARRNPSGVRYDGVMLRVLIDGEALATDKISGIGHVALETTKALLRSPEIKDCQVTVLVPSGQGARAVSRGIDEKVINDRMPRIVFRLLARMKWMPPIDWLLGGGVYIFPNISNWRLSHRSRSLTYLHDVIFARLPQTVSPKNLAYITSNIKRWMRQSETVVTVSEFSKNEIQDVFPGMGDELVVVSNGVDTQAFTPRSQEEITAIKEHLGITKEYLLYVGNLEPRKNVGTLVEAYLALPPQIKQRYELVLISGAGWGSDELAEKIHTLMQQGESIVWPDAYVEDAALPALYSGATATLLFSSYEGFGLSPLQALACGSMVAVADIPAIREVVGDCGFYSSGTDPKSISGTIYQALQASPKTREQLRAKGRKRAESYSWDETIKPLLAIIKQQHQA